MCGGPQVKSLGGHHLYPITLCVSATSCQVESSKTYKWSFQKKSQLRVFTPALAIRLSVRTTVQCNGPLCNSNIYWDDLIRVKPYLCFRQALQRLHYWLLRSWCLRLWEERNDRVNMCDKKSWSTAHVMKLMLFLPLGLLQLLEPALTCSHPLFPTLEVFLNSGV